MNDASSDAMKTIALASSSERPRRSIGTVVTRAALFSGVRVKRVNMRVSVGPGATVRAWARFVKYEGRFLVFDVEARSGEHLIGRGRVFRAIVHPGEHGAKAQARAQQ